MSLVYVRQMRYMSNVAHLFLLQIIVNLFKHLARTGRFIWLVLDMDVDEYNGLVAIFVKEPLRIKDTDIDCGFCGGPRSIARRDQHMGPTSSISTLTYIASTFASFWRLRVCTHWFQAFSRPLWLIAKNVPVMRAVCKIYTSCQAAAGPVRNLYPRMPLNAGTGRP